jgi:ferric-dicitrate binding protein FerR (iron transport regulator)
MSIDRIWDLLAKKFNNEISSQELEELELLLRENQDAFQLNELLSRFGELPFKPISDEAMKRRSINAIKETIDSREEQVNNENIISDYERETSFRNRRKGIRIGVAILASVLLFVTIVWFPFWKKNGHGKEMASINEIKTDAGSKTTVNLPDGSVVVLNAGSKLSYNKEFGISSREIKLTGEAYFDIRKNPDMPLVVHAGTVDIWVKGTTFNVKAYLKDSTIEAALFTGIIELISQKDPERKILLRPNEKIIINKKGNNKSLQLPDDKKVLNEVETISLDNMKPDPVDSSYAETAWLQNKLVFRSEAFIDLARSMERRYNISIEFTDPNISELIFTGSFSNETLEEALEALRSSVPFHYKIENKIVFISK